MLYYNLPFKYYYYYYYYYYCYCCFLYYRPCVYVCVCDFNVVLTKLNAHEAAVGTIFVYVWYDSPGFEPAISRIRVCRSIQQVTIYIIIIPVFIYVLAIWKIFEWCLAV